MNKPLVGHDVLIHCYKHDGNIHRCWNKGFVLEETSEHFIVINNRTLVTESDGRKWYTREPAICYFPKHEWYNVICMIRKNGVHFYCNIASPTLYDGDALKYIDYDLDFTAMLNIFVFIQNLNSSIWKQLDIQIIINILNCLTIINTRRC